MRQRNSYGFRWKGARLKFLQGLVIPGGRTSFASDISRDEQMMVTGGSVLDVSTSTYRPKIAFFKVDSGAPLKVFDADARISSSAVRAVQFTPNGKSIVYPIRGEDNVDNLWQQELDGKGGRQITHFTSDQINRFQWSPNGKKLLVWRGHTESDVVLLRDTAK
jgi:Tol biopolymer transport system component